MRRETELFFASIIREDRSILDFLDAPYTFVNERLARALRHRGRDGPGVPARGRCRPRRGGVLTQASVLTVSSYATRTSPVLRGKWILENLLDAPPPPPPPGVPTSTKRRPAPTASVRQQLEAHRANPTCAVLPPPHGSARLRARELRRHRRVADDATASSRSTPPAQLPDGRTFHGPVELRAILGASTTPSRAR